MPGSVEVEGERVSEKILESGIDVSSVLVEESGESLVSSVASEGLQVATDPDNYSPESAVPEFDSVSDLTVDQITYNAPRATLRECTVQDLTLLIRHLADTDSDEYAWDNSLIFRHRLDECGQPCQQLCLPQQFRMQCLKLAHEIFGQNKTTQDVKRLFHWPSMTSDIAKYCHSCDVCQRHTKVQPNACPMQEKRGCLFLPREFV